MRLWVPVCAFVCLYSCLCVCHEQLLGECGLHSNRLSWWSVINSLSGVDDLDSVKKKRGAVRYIK